MLTRRSLIAGLAAAALPAGAASADAVLTEDGLYRQPWFLDSLLELADDLQAASEKQKHFAILWDLRGCPFCKKTHLVNFARPEIVTYIRERFDIVQLNIIGAREVVDFDGEKLPERAFARKYGVRYTPTFQFFSGRADAVASKAAAQREITRVQGYQEPKDFLATFRYIAEGAYEKGTLADFLKANS